MNIGIIGAEEKKFTPLEKHIAVLKITYLLEGVKPPHTVVSGRCHLGGVDVWAEEIADSLGCPTLIFPPKIHAWEGGYKQRNIEIAKASDVIYVIVVRELPPGVLPDKWNKDGCYHCRRRATKKIPNKVIINPASGNVPHVKSGACWTAWYAVEKLGKEAHWIVI